MLKIVKSGFSLLFLSSLLLVSCSADNDNENTSQLEEKQTIAGQIPDAAGKTIVAQVYNVDRWLQMGQTNIDDQGNFNLKLPKEAFVVQLIVDQSAVPIVLGGNDSVFIRCDYPLLMNNFRISNLEDADELNKMVSLNAQFSEKYSEQMSKLRALPPGASEADPIVKILQAGKKPMEDFAISFLDKKPGSPVAQLFAMQLFPDMGLENWNVAYGDILRKVLEVYLEKFPEARFTRGLENNLSTWVDSYEGALNEEKRKAFYGNLDRNVDVGSPAPDIWMDMVNGGDMKLSDLRGKYVLIDFWASWCGPCRKENPNVVRLYKKYKDKGFTVFSVSLDDNATAWKSAIESDALEWPYHVSDLKKWNSIVVQLYKFEGIPHTVLIDKKGTIIGKNLRGMDLENKLKELFGS
jgi:thiol-disulfide isomerase/thioredoxin